jgi:hypothetical protein
MNDEKLGPAILPNCLRCAHYFITYNLRRPYGCRAMGFTSRRNPARVVFESSGMHCQMFHAKKSAAGLRGQE